MPKLKICCFFDVTLEPEHLANVIYISGIPVTHIILRINLTKPQNKDAIMVLNSKIKHHKLFHVNRNPLIPPDLRPAVYCTMVREGDEGVIDALWTRFEEEPSHYERVVILESFACSHEGEFIFE